MLAVPSSPEQIIKVILLKRNLDNLIYWEKHINIFCVQKCITIIQPHGVMTLVTFPDSPWTFRNTSDQI